MKYLIDEVCKSLDKDTPPIVADAFKRMQERFNKPPEPIMTKEEFEALPYTKQCMLICNMPGCGEVVCTHGMLCVKHNEELKKWA